MVFAPRNGELTTRQANDTQAEGRVARMSALEAVSSESHGTPITGGVAGARRRPFGDNSESEAYGDTPESRGGGGPPITARRNGSLSSQSVLGGLDDPSSPLSGSGGQYSSPEGVASGQSEQLPFFKDYYSQDEIHPNDKVATLWAYQPRAGDEFELVRGDMLKVVGIWDDGWATGVRIDERAENYDAKHKVQRDSGVSNGSGRKGESPPPSGEIKAFPVCPSPTMSIFSFADLHSLYASACPSIGRGPLREITKMAISRQTLGPEDTRRISFGNLLPYARFPALIPEAVWLGFPEHSWLSLFRPFHKPSLPTPSYRLKPPISTSWSLYRRAAYNLGFSEDLFLLLS